MSQEGGNIKCAATAIRSAEIMISPLMSKVNLSHLADFAALATVQWWKPLLPLEPAPLAGAFGIPAFANGVRGAQLR
jgi:hypothetical protein